MMGLSPIIWSTCSYNAILFLPLTVAFHFLIKFQLLILSAHSLIANFFFKALDHYFAHILYPGAVIPLLVNLFIAPDSHKAENLLPAPC